MKIPDDEKEALITGLMDLLDHEKTEMAEEIIRVTGRTAINFHRVFQDNRGRQIQPGRMYNLTIPTQRKVNHRQRIGHIISDAANAEEMSDRLAKYLTENAKDMDAVVQSIPASALLIHKNKTSQNDN